MKTIIQRCRSTRAGRKYVRQVYDQLSLRMRKGEAKLMKKFLRLEEMVEIVAQNLQHTIRNWKKGREDQ